MNDQNLIESIKSLVAYSQEVRFHVNEDTSASYMACVADLAGKINAHVKHLRLIDMSRTCHMLSMYITQLSTEQKILEALLGGRKYEFSS